MNVIKYKFCPYCGLLFKHKSYFVSHINEVHLKIKCECNKCKKVYTKKCKLRRHRICGECGIGFRRIDNMKKHKKVHEKKCKSN